MEWVNVADGSMSSHPVIFTKDSEYFFLASSNSVLIHSRATGQVVSVLSANHGASEAHKARITGLVINPANPLQLLTSSLDGTLKIWDFLDAVLLSTIDLKLPITHLAAHGSIKGRVIVAVRKPRADAPPLDSLDPASWKGNSNTIFFSVSLSASNDKKGKEVAGGKSRNDVVRIGKTRDAQALKISPDGKWLAAIGNRKLMIARLAKLEEGFIKFVSDDNLSCFAFHPTQPTLATGDEKGKIRIWYCLDDEFIASQPKPDANQGERHAPTTLMHWHSHSVASLAFTPNGSHLLSGGEEAVLVLWALHGNGTEKEFVPRLGAPIASIAIADGLDGREQEFAVGLKDGSIAFVGAMSLKPSRVFSRVKIDYSRQLASPQQQQQRAITDAGPLAVHPGTGHLVLASGHASSIQFYDHEKESHVLELEVAPSNRVSRADEAAIEPTRVRMVAFSSAASPTTGDKGEWMVTLDSRNNDSQSQVSSESSLKFWRWDPRRRTYALNTRIDKPHGGELTSIGFSPVAHEADSYLLVTTGDDGRVKTWKLERRQLKGERTETYWVCRSSFSYRDSIPTSSAWSPDGSLLAIAQGPYVTLWEPSSNVMQTVLACPELTEATNVLFTGRAGRYVVVAGAKSMVVWDLVCGTVKWRSSSSSDASSRVGLLSHDVNPSLFVTVSNEKDGSGGCSKVEVYDPSSGPNPVQRFGLPFHVQVTAGVNPLADGPRARWEGVTDVPPSFFAITKDSDIVQAGPYRTPLFSSQLEVGAGGSSSSSGGRIGATSGQSLRGVSSVRRTLFDDLFGGAAMHVGGAWSEEASTTDSIWSSANAADEKGKAKARGGGGGEGISKLFSVPSHLLPSVTLMLDPFLDALLAPRRVEEPTSAVVMAGRDAVEEEVTTVERGEEKVEEAIASVGGGEANERKRMEEAMSSDLSFITELFKELGAEEEKEERGRNGTSLNGRERKATTEAKGGEGERTPSWKGKRSLASTPESRSKRNGPEPEKVPSTPTNVSGGRRKRKAAE
ncbi:WD40 repeat-like protein [Violaceomyces palustris]|uniref:WD40 repeat-like protein n=1 Tax=Violaceomyces palustris TaxID=1673888 RepID=A0ACD0NM68_9BASI|nr:WD40 repeat-like protein [Violaceomyces palustris]